MLKMLPFIKEENLESLFPPDLMLAFSFKEQTIVTLFSLDHSGFIQSGYKKNGEARHQFAAAKRPNFESKRNNVI